ncbi:hypothetical protein ACTFIZ_004120 [Dictyostelium cf. discoideum]
MSLKRDNTHIIRIDSTEIIWNSKDKDFINVYNNYIKLCEFKSTPISIFNSNLNQLNFIEKKNDYLQFNLQYYLCDNTDHLSTIQLRTIMNSQYDITKSNSFCTQCGSKQDRDAINNITLCKNSNFFKFTGNEFDQFIQKIKKTSGAKFRKESLDFECGQCGHKITISGQVLINGKLKNCKSCGKQFQNNDILNINNTSNLNNDNNTNNTTKTTTTKTTTTTEEEIETTKIITATSSQNNKKTSENIINNINQYLKDFNSNINLNDFNQLKNQLNIKNVKDYCYIIFNINLKCGHINDFNANQFIKPIIKEWKCRECDSCIARVKLLNGLSLLKDFNYISSNNYFIATQQIKNFNNDQVFQFKIEIINPDCNHSRELVGSQICKLQDSNLGCPKCLKSGIVSSTIINSINYHLNQKSFTINNYKQIIDEIQSLDSYNIQYYQFTVQLSCGHDHGIKNSFLYYNNDKEVEFICQICNPQKCTLKLLNQLEEYMKKNNFSFLDGNDSIDQILNKDIQSINHDTIISLEHNRCGHYYSFNLNSIKFSNFNDKDFKCPECDLGKILYDNIKLFLEKNSTTLSCKSNLTQINKIIKDSVNRREIIFSFTFKECSHQLSIISNDIINYSNLIPRCSICNPNYKYQDKFSFYGLKLVNDSSAVPKFTCPENHIVVNPSKWICSFCHVGGRFYENLIMKTVSNYLKTDDIIAQYLQLVGPTHYSYGENLSGFYDFSVQINIDTINKKLVKLGSTPSFLTTKTLVTLNFEIDEVHHFKSSKYVKKDAKKNQLHSMDCGNRLVRISYNFIDNLFIPSMAPIAIISLLQSAIVSMINNQDNIIFISDNSYEDLHCFKARSFEFINLFDLFETDYSFPMDYCKVNFDFTKFLKQ